ncbi:MAG: plastocyanin/azurin family copper-binding protein [Planctomycetes bacterium]|nr:plastocyanin/azurin family copper-binding protein [Planctomycetota bacterium]
MTRAARAALGLLAALTLAGVGAVVVEPDAPAPPLPAPVTVVTMTNDNRFEPLRVTIRAGEAVEWRNTSLVLHSITTDPDRAVRKDNVAAPPGAAPFFSGDLYEGDVYRHVFVVPGTYKYLCQPHEAHGMVGWVEVLPLR